MEISRVKHVIAEMAHKKPSAKVTMERLCHKFVTSYLVHFLHYH